MGKFAKKLWDLERPYLDNVLYHKGFKKNVYPKGSAPPLSYASKQGLMKLYHRAEVKKPAKGHVRRYRKENESSAAMPPGRKPGTTKPMTSNYKQPIQIKKGPRVVVRKAGTGPPPSKKPFLRRSLRLKGKK